MIVDLARNDLGRVCEYGSISVPELCAVEAHPGLHHLVSTVVGRLRPDVGIAELVRATFPPASVTGAPKPRVLQAIEDLEPVRRGIYCGAIGWIDGDAARAELAVAIRTFTITHGATYLGVGGGIVADSHRGCRMGGDRVEGEPPARGGLRSRGRSQHSVIVWIDGALIPLDDARISPLDHGLTVGDGVFETLRVYDTVPFAWRRHYARLRRVGRRRSASTCPTRDTLRDACRRGARPRTACATHGCASPSPAVPRRRVRRDARARHRSRSSSRPRSTRRRRRPTS